MPCCGPTICIIVPLSLFDDLLPVETIEKSVNLFFNPLVDRRAVTLHIPTMYFNWCANCNSKSQLYVSNTPLSMPTDSWNKNREFLFLLSWLMNATLLNVIIAYFFVNKERATATKTLRGLVCWWRQYNQYLNWR